MPYTSKTDLTYEFFIYSTDANAATHAYSSLLFFFFILFLQT